MMTPGGAQGLFTLLQHGVGAAVMHVIGGKHGDSAMAVLGVVPREERPAEGDGGVDIVECWCIGAVMALSPAGAAQGETWRGLTVAPEHRCAPYDKKRDYPYPQSVEPEIVRALGAVYGPYTGTCFTSQTETDIEHIVAASEAHDYASYCTSLFR